jgi:4'-phosphopantetheinyl transferase EntD
MIEQILPMTVAAAESFKFGPIVTPFPEDAAVIDGGELQAARACASAMLEELAFPAFTLPTGQRGMPRWPAGITGSITYCAGYRAASAAMTRDVALLGVDAELNEGLPDEGMLDLIARAEEREHLAILEVAMSGIYWDRLLLSAKLSVYKAWFPVENWWLNLKAANIVIEPYGGTFTAKLQAPGPLVNGVPVAEMHGRWLAHQEFLITTVVVPARVGGGTAGSPA